MRARNITILYGLPDTNSGGTALGLSLVAGLRSVFPRCAISYVSQHSKQELIDKAYPFMRAAHSDLRIRPFPIVTRSDSAVAGSSTARRLRNLLWILRTVPSPLFLLFPGLLRGETVREMRESDLVVCRGTQVFYDREGYPLQNLLAKYMLCFPILLARRLGVPCVVYPQSFGPLLSGATERLVRRTLNGTALVLVREELSRRYLEKIGVDPGRLRVVPDSVFALGPPAPGEVAAACAGEDLAEGRFVVFVVRELMEAGRDIRDVFSRFGDVFRELRLRGSVDRAVIVTQCHGFAGYGGFESDEKVSAELHRFLRREFGGRVLLLSRPRPPGEAIALYGGARYVVSVRLHSAIFGLVAGTPALALSYWGHKTKGVMALAGLDDLSFSFEDLGRGALAQTVAAMEEDYDGARARIAAAAGRMREEARKTPALLAAAGERHGE